MISFKQCAAEQSGASVGGEVTLEDLERLAKDAARIGEPIETWEERMRHHAWCRCLLTEKEAERDG